MMNCVKIDYSPEMFLVSNSFVDKYIKDANPSFVKLYIYILRHSNNPGQLILEKIAEDTGLLQSDVIAGIKYWQKCGVLSARKEDKCVFIDVTPSENSSDKKTVLNENKSEQDTGNDEPKVKEKKFPKTSASSSYKSSDVLETISSDKELKHFFSLIQQMLNKSLTVNDYKIIYSFIDYLKLPERVILTMFEHCISIGKTSMRYIESVAYAWADRGITDVIEAEKFINEVSEKQATLKKFKRKFKISGRDFTDIESNYIFDWVFNLGASDEMIMQAFEKTVINTGKISFSYINAILYDESNPHKISDEEKSNVKKSKFRNYPSSYGISDDEKKMIDKMMAEFDGGDDNNGDKK